MHEIIIFCFISSTISYSAGYIFLNYLAQLKIDYKNNITIYFIYGFIFISFLSLLINFFLPLDKNVNSVFGIFFLFFFFNILKKENYKEILFYLLIVTFFSSLILVVSEANRPDAGLYHLPYTNIINENKIILGAANIHFRFGHTSIIQYLNAFNLNYLFTEKGILIPQAQVIICVIIYFFREYFNQIRTSNKLFLKVFLFFIILFSLYSYNRYGSFGNDASSNIFYILLVYEFLKLNEIKELKLKNLFNILYLSVFCFTLKPFMLLSFLFPLTIILIYKKNLKVIFYNRNFLITFFLLFIFFLKNILISGCLIYPQKLTCIDNLSWGNKFRTQSEAVLGEAWSKDWSNFKNYNQIHPKNYIENFVWFKTWTKHHFKTVLNKFLPFFVLSTILGLFLRIKLKKNYTNSKNNLKQNQILTVGIVIILFSLIIWFCKFPIYRFGSGFFGSFFVLSLSCILTNNINNKNIKIFNNLKFVLFFFIFLILIKNFDRIYKNYNLKYVDHPWPKIYSFTENNKKKEYEIVKKGDKLLFYKVSDGLCMYGKSPCTYYVEQKINMKYTNGYKVYYIIN